MSFEYRNRLARGHDLPGVLLNRRTAMTSVLGLILLAGCTPTDSEKTDGGQTGDEFDQIFQRVSGETDREKKKGPAQGGASESLSEFAWSFYGESQTPGENFVYSPYSIHSAAAMLYAGAAGNTQSEMQSVFSFSDEGAPFHQDQNDLIQCLDARNIEATGERNAQHLKVTNDFWMEKGFEPEADFLNVLSSYYGAPVHVWDAEPEEVRGAINDKISDDTSGLIPELLPQGSLDDAVFVLTNALYFKARWGLPFLADATETSPFTDGDGAISEADLMFNEDSYAYRDDGDVEVVSLGYSGGELEFVAMMPQAGEFESFASGLDAARVAELTTDLPYVRMNLRFPKMDLETGLPLTEELKEAGMNDAFETQAADFSPLAPSVYLTNAFHQARLILDEEGTEAAAATAFVGGTTSVPPEPTVDATFDRAFVFFIRDIETQAPLFVGHYSKGQ